VVQGSKDRMIKTICHVLRFLGQAVGGNAFSGEKGFGVAREEKQGMRNLRGKGRGHEV